MNSKSSVMAKMRVRHFEILGFDADTSFLLARGDKDILEEIKANNEVLADEFDKVKQENQEAKDFNLDDFKNSDLVKNQDNPMHIEDKKKRIGRIVIDENGKRTITYDN
jgi:hypothetical protein